MSKNFSAGTVLLRGVRARLRAAGLNAPTVFAGLNDKGFVNILVTPPGYPVLKATGAKTPEGSDILTHSPAPATAPSYEAVAALFPGQFACPRAKILTVRAL